MGGVAAAGSGTGRGCVRWARALIPLCPGDTGRLLWQDNWVTFLDSMLQMSILGTPQSCLRLPIRIAALRIDPATHRRQVQAPPGEAPGSPARTPVPALPGRCDPPSPVTPCPAHPHSVSPQPCRWW